MVLPEILNHTMLLKLFLGFIIIVSVGQVIYRVARGKKSAILWIIIGVLGPFAITRLIKSPWIKKIGTRLLKQLNGGSLETWIHTLISIAIAMLVVIGVYTFLVEILDGKEENAKENYGESSIASTGEDTDDRMSN